MSHPTEGGPRNVAAVMGLHNSSPYMTRTGSKDSNAMAISSPSMRPRSVHRPTTVMYIRVSGRMALYFDNVSERADFFSLDAPTFFCPVAEYSEAVRPADFFLLDLEDAPPRRVSSVCLVASCIRKKAAGCSLAKERRRRSNDVDVLDTLGNDEASTTPEAMSAERHVTAHVVRIRKERYMSF